MHGGVGERGLLGLNQPQGTSLCENGVIFDTASKV